LKSYPKIVDPNVDLSGPCVRPGATKELHRVPRQPVTRPITTFNPDAVLQDEAGIPFNDEVTTQFLYDDYPHTLVS
jgi:hypothetical protein